MWMAHKNKRIKVINIQVHSNGKSNLFVISVYIFCIVFFRLFFGVVRRGGSVGGGSVEGVRGPVRKVVHGPGS